jgi:hypothetical protein
MLILLTLPCYLCPIIIVYVLLGIHTLFSVEALHCDVTGGKEIGISRKTMMKDWTGVIFVRPF